MYGIPCIAVCGVAGGCFRFFLFYTAKLELSRKGFPASAGTERTIRISDKLERDCH